ncbi:hypothetical protein C1893_18720 [Pseudomonas sp. MPR-ANC1]|nr:hypothetical protein C1893_18720 [Pseudomonas sp. MPR-ANC1]
MQTPRFRRYTEAMPSLASQAPTGTEVSVQNETTTRVKRHSVRASNQSILWSKQYDSGDLVRW